MGFPVLSKIPHRVVRRNAQGRCKTVLWVIHLVGSTPDAPITREFFTRREAMAYIVANTPK